MSEECLRYSPPARYCMIIPKLDRHLPVLNMERTERTQEGTPEGCCNIAPTMQLCTSGDKSALLRYSPRCAQGLLLDINADVLGLLRWKHVRGVPRTVLQHLMSVLITVVGLYMHFRLRGGVADRCGFCLHCAASGSRKLLKEGGHLANLRVDKVPWQKTWAPVASRCSACWSLQCLCSLRALSECRMHGARVLKIFKGTGNLTVRCF